MSINGNLYGIVGQPLTPDYLAKQLPLFQQRVPKSTLKSLKFTTNAPPNLPTPPLYPGEEVLLQEHRIVCTETFSEPAVGAVYITNFRVIFCGNAISDPESMDALQNASTAQTGRFKDLGNLGGDFSSKLKDKFSNRKNESNFHSFLYPDQVDSETDPFEKVKARRSQRMENLKKKIGSLRRGVPRNRLKTSTLPPPSHPPPILNVQNSCPPPTSLDEEMKRRGVNYDAETASLDSTSASSLSEFSSTTGTDERSIQSPLREVGSGITAPIDIDGGDVYNQADGSFSPSLMVADSELDRHLSMECTVSSTSYQLLHSFVENSDTTLKDVPSVSDDRNHSPSSPSEKTNDQTSPTFDSSRGYLLKAKSLDTSPVTARKKSLQKFNTFDESSNSLHVSRSKRFWENSIVILESDSDSESSVSHLDATSPTSQHTDADRDEGQVAKGYAKVEVLGPRRKPPPIPSNSSPDFLSATSTSCVVKDHLGQLARGTNADLGIVSTAGIQGPSYSNMQILRDAAVANDVARGRSKSTSPLVLRKPKPLPRQLQDSRGRGEFVISLPADFKPSPRPPPKPGKFLKDELPLSPSAVEDTPLSPPPEETMPLSPLLEKSYLSPPPEESTPSSDTTQSSPEHHGGSPSIEGNSLGLPTRDERGTSPTPVAPPRRKRRTKQGKTKGANSQHKVNDQIDKSHDHHDGSCDPLLVNGSHDHERPVMKKDTPMDSNSQHSLGMLIGEDSDQSRFSIRTSIAAHQSSRPQSVISAKVTPTNDFATYSLEIERGSVAYSSMPARGTGATTWSPQSELRRKKRITPASTRYTLSMGFPLYSIHSVTKLPSVTLKEQGVKLSEGILILCRTFHSLKLHVHPHNTFDADSLRELLEKKFIVSKPLHELFAFPYSVAIRHPNPTFIGNRNLPSFFKLSAEMERLGLLDSKLWRVSRILTDHPDVCFTYPPHLIMPICIPDLDIIRGTSLYKEGRFPTLTWLHPSGSALLRGAATKEERGQGTVNHQTDEALLRAICASSKGPATLCVFTEKGVIDNKHPTLKPEEMRTYYYHGCKFIYAEAPPTFKSVRHSFNKLQALLENKLPDEDYLLALDSTKWLQRVGNLLSTANNVVNILTVQQAHVLVCYESGWDRTTQIVSLAQLLADPYYRTMDGFQILIQKEWVWFGHPFRTRHSHRGKAKTDGPIFLQWLDCVWQIVWQCPSAFEFNEKFLVSLAEESYSGRFGTFMTDCEQIRKQTFTVKGFDHMSVSTHTVSYWTWVAMVNSVGRNFFNELYDPTCYPSVVVPSSSVPQLKLWTSNYCRYKTQEFTHQPSVVHKQLEDLLATYKKLKALQKFSESGHSISPLDSSAIVPPPLMPRDEIYDHSHHNTPVAKLKPTPPPKPTSSKPHFDSIEQYLIKEGLDPSICKHVELGRTICQGQLQKIGAVRKNWLQRWFVLDFDRQYLAYFESKMAYENHDVPKGVIRLTDINKVYQNINKREHLMKHIVTIETSQRTYLIQAPSIPTMDIWQTCLTIPVDAFDSRTT